MATMHLSLSNWLVGSNQSCMHPIIFWKGNSDPGSNVEYALLHVDKLLFGKYVYTALILPYGLPVTRVRSASRWAISIGNSIPYLATMQIHNHICIFSFIM